MAYNRVNKLRMYKKIVALTNEHYDPDVMSSYAKIHRLYIYPVYPVSYSHYRTIIVRATLKGCSRRRRKHTGSGKTRRRENCFSCRKTTRKTIAEKTMNIFC